MTDATTRQRDDYQEAFGIGAILSGTFSVLLRNLPTFLILGVIGSLPTIAVVVIGGVEAIAPEAASADPESVTIAAIGQFSFFISSLLVSALVAEAAFNVRVGMRRSIGHYLGNVMPRIVVIAAAVILQLIITALGFVLLIVPGLMAMVIFYVTVPATVVERIGPVAALSRSAQLTEGYRWPIFGLAILVMLIAILLAFGAGAVAGGIGGFAGAFTGVNGAILGGAVGALAGQFISVLYGGIVAALAYARLREIKDGLSSDELAAIFD